MAVVALAYGLLVQRSLWYPINLLAAVAMPRMARADWTCCAPSACTALVLGRHRARPDLDARRSPLRRDPADAAAPAHALGRPDRAAALDGPAVGAAGRDQSRRSTRASTGRGSSPRRSPSGSPPDSSWRARSRWPPCRAWPLADARRHPRRDGPGPRGRDGERIVAGLAALGLMLVASVALAGCDALPGKPQQRRRTSCCRRRSWPSTRSTRATAPAVMAPMDARRRPAAQRSRLSGPRARASGSRTSIAQGVPGTAQPAFAQSAGGELTDAQIDALVAGADRHVGSPGRRQATRRCPPYAAEPGGDAERGKTVYAAACASCHGPDGTGGPKGGTIVDPVVSRPGERSVPAHRR